MKLRAFILSVIFLTIGLSGCEMDEILSGLDGPEMLNANDIGFVQSASNSKSANKVTGFVEVLWKGADKGGDMGNKPDELLCFADFNAHEGDSKSDPKGEIIYRVLQTDSSLHREIIADVYGVYIDVATSKAWVVASVISDSKGCSGNGGGGHDPGCSSGGHDDTGGGCSGDDDSHDGGCSHDDTGGDTGTDGGCSHDDTGGDTGTDGGCSHDDTGGDSGMPGDTGTDGGCSHDDTGGDTGTDGGCSHDDTGGDTGTDGGCSHDDTGGSGGAGGSDMAGSDGKGNPLSGKNCRIGQIIAVKMHDGGSPGTGNDGITWKWFSPEADFVPSMENIDSWPHLCKKTIIAGNLVVHD